MLTRPELSDEIIISSLKTSYAITPTEIIFLPIGNAANTWIFKVKTAQKNYFLKLRKGKSSPVSVIAEKILSEHGITQVISALVPPNDCSSSANGLITQISQTLISPTQIPSKNFPPTFFYSLYPLIEGSIWADIPNNLRQFCELGICLKKIHKLNFNSEILTQFTVENFNSDFYQNVSQLQNHFKENPSKHGQSSTDLLGEDFYKNQLKKLWRKNLKQVAEIIIKYQELAKSLKTSKIKFVLTHGDLHSHNLINLNPIEEDLILTKTNSIGSSKFYILDWDEVRLAPKERDLMFFYNQEGHEDFFRGYGELHNINKLALEFYQSEWLVQEISDYADRINSTTTNDKDKESAIEKLAALFAN